MSTIDWMSWLIELNVYVQFVKSIPRAFVLTSFRARKYWLLSARVSIDFFPRALVLTAPRARKYWLLSARVSIEFFPRRDIDAEFPGFFFFALFCSMIWILFRIECTWSFLVNCIHLLIAQMNFVTWKENNSWLSTLILVFWIIKASDSILPPIHIHLQVFEFC
jgi:hypothetical protein